MKKRYVAIIVAVMGFLLVSSIGVMLYAFMLNIEAQERLNNLQEVQEKLQLTEKQLKECMTESKE